MSSAVVNQIPDGAEVTVTLKCGKTFTGYEASSEALRKDQVLRLEQPMTAEGADGDTRIFWADHSQISCVELVNIR